MELYLNSEWTEDQGNSYIAEAIAWSENGNHATIYTVGSTAEEANAKLIAWIIHEPCRRVCPVKRKGDESLEKSAYLGPCGLEALEIALPLFINQTHSHE